MKQLVTDLLRNHPNFLDKNSEVNDAQFEDSECRLTIRSKKISKRKIELNIEFQFKGRYYDYPYYKLKKGIMILPVRGAIIFHNILSSRGKQSKVSDKMLQYDEIEYLLNFRGCVLSYSDGKLSYSAILKNKRLPEIQYISSSLAGIADKISRAIRTV
ncbi:hypothetical protein K6119_09480 [Paracrocinitomix mangrovi]|uniref:hypothetical protein n=1 Tax=Paracrocinitomix mangrovi TaxID=2862509 RepID=UPI001C8DE5D7|nr:hypothetical protein [Paracrocinitomix mangrovi]UKN03721.1 hypothetical protein K6119_09480 [Paracrocinitomix mangrovi]